MAPRGKGNGKENAIGKDVYLVKVDEDTKTAEVARLPIGVENDEGETFYLVRDHAVKALTDVAFPGNSRLIKALVAQNIRAQFKAAPDFETVTVDLNIDNMDRNKGKVAKSDEDEEGDEEDNESQETVEVSVPSYDTTRF